MRFRFTLHAYFITTGIFIARNGSCGKVMFSQACDKNSVHRGDSAQRNPEIHTILGSPPRANTPQADTSLGRHPLGRHTLWADTPSG